VIIFRRVKWTIFGMGFMLLVKYGMMINIIDKMMKLIDWSDFLWLYGKLLCVMLMYVMYANVRQQKVTFITFCVRCYLLNLKAHGHPLSDVIYSA
jgi:hypothetical protein